MRHRESQRKFAQGALLTGVVALCLQIIGVVCPTWNVIEGRGGYTIQEGMWFAVAVPAEQNSSESRVLSSVPYIIMNFGRHGTFSVLESARWSQFRVMTMCGLMGALNTVLSAAILVARLPGHPCPLVVGVGLISSLAACCLVLVPVIKVSMLVSGSVVMWGLCWARLVALIGTIVQFGCSALYVFLASQTIQSLVRNKGDTDSMDDEETSGVVFERDALDSPVGGVVNPGLELPAYCELENMEPPPTYTERPDDQSHISGDRRDTHTQT